MQKKRFWKQDTKKLDCMATIKMKEVLKFPDHKVLYYCIVQKHILVWFSIMPTLYTVALSYKDRFPLDGVFRAERNFLLCFH